ARRRSGGIPCACSYGLLRHAPDGRLNAVVRHAPAERAGHAFADLGVARMRVAIEQRLRGHDLAVLTEAALRDLFVDPRLLERVQHTVSGQPFERRDFAFDARGRRDARPDRGAIDDDGARAALAESAAEFRTLEAEIVPQNI